MVKLSIEEIRDIIRPVGLSPMKSKGIHGLSKILIDKYDGKVPKTFEALESLPCLDLQALPPHVKLSSNYIYVKFYIVSH